MTKYYFAGTHRVAMRKYTVPTSMAVEYLLGDHLGSTSLTADSNGTKVSEIRYKPWGEIRYSWTWGIATTPGYKLSSYTFTGQYSYMDDPTTTGVTEGFGLMFYNARFYSPYINQFISADTIVPNQADPQSWNRYSYTRNNPLRYTDPSGHIECEMESNGTCMNSKRLKLWQYATDTINELGRKDDLEAVARIVDKAARIYGSFEKMIPALSEIFLGIEESNSLTVYNAATEADPYAALGRTDCEANAQTGSFGDAGFHQDFRDTFSQPFHFWAYVATAANTEGTGPASYLPGMGINAAANVYHEIIKPDGAGATWQDFALAAVGSNIGTLVSIGAIPPDQLGNTIRDNVGGGGPGAFYVDPLIFLLPLEGNR